MGWAWAPGWNCLSLEGAFRVSSHRVLCETVKDFVARVGRAYEKATESSEESEVMAKKVCPGHLGGGGQDGEALLHFPLFPASALF